MANETKVLREVRMHNATLRLALAKCLRVFKIEANAGRYPQCLLQGGEIGGGVQFIIDALDSWSEEMPDESNAEPAPEPQPKRKMVLPNAKSHGMTPEATLHYEDDWCPKAGCLVYCDQSVEIPAVRPKPAADAPVREHLPPKEAAAAAIGILNNAERERYETREPDAPRRWIVEECPDHGGYDGTIYFDGRESVSLRVVRQLEPLTDDDERDERLAKVIEDVDRDYSGSETISKRLRVRIARAVIAEYAAILGGKEE